MTAPRDWRTANAVVLRLDDLTPFRGRGDWGPWRLDRRARELWTDAGGYRYGIDLDTCTTSAQVLDWICQIAGKQWALTPARQHRIVAGLVNALNDVLHPQANLCSFGQSKRLSKAQLRYLAENAPEP